MKATQDFQEFASLSPVTAEHFVQFYESDLHLIESIKAYFSPALLAGDTAMMIATKRVREGVERRLIESGLPIAHLIASERFLSLDAAETLQKFMVNGLPDARLFFEVIGSTVSKSLVAGRLFAFGDMVALLWADGKHEAAVRLEEIWNDFIAGQAFSLFCAYPLSGFDGDTAGGPFTQICKIHSHVIPTERYMTLRSSREQLEAISILQQKALVLEAEIERRKKAEESLRLSENRLRESGQRKDEFLAVLAHELRNPLSAIANGVTLLERPNTKEDDRVWIHDVLKRQVTQLTRLLDDLLDVSRITSGKIALKLEPLQLGGIIERAVQSVCPLFEKQNHRLSVESAGYSACRVIADPSRLEQIFVNLLSNAAKYTPAGGEITFSVRQEQNDVIISVKDSGMGIAPEMLPRVFELYSQDKRTLDRSDGGLGIGLSIVKRLVELHQGTIVVHSDGLGKGSEFILTLRSAEKPETVLGAVRQNCESEVIPVKILIVDDNQDAALALGLLLRSDGQETRIAHCGAEALNALEQFMPEIALLDIGLPGMDGYELARRIRERAGASRITLVAISGYGQPEYRARSSEAGFDQHFIKPVDCDELLGLVRGCRANK